MKNKAAILSTILCLFPIFLAAAVYNELPQQIAIHFDGAGNPDNYAPKATAAFGIPLLAAINLYSNFRVTRDPKVENASLALRMLSKLLVPVLSIVLVPVTLFAVMGKQIPTVMIASAIAGAAFVICGNYLPKCKRNYTIGIKLPWTLDNEDNWNCTHRFSGFVWVVGGFIVIANAFVRIPYLLIAVVICLLLLLFLYSYFLYSRQASQA